jgi:hypothetical protein
MVHSDSTVVILLYKQMLPVSDCWHVRLSTHLTLSVILSALSWIVHVLLWVSLTLCLMSVIRSPLRSWPITSNFSSVLILSHQFFYLDCTRWCIFTFLTHFCNKGQCCDTWLYHQRNQSIHTTDETAVMSLSASLLQKISAAMDRLCWIENHHGNSKSVINFQVVLKQFHVKWDLPMLLLCAGCLATLPVRLPFSLCVCTIYRLSGNQAHQPLCLIYSSSIHGFSSNQSFASVCVCFRMLLALEAQVEPLANPHGIYDGQWDSDILLQTCQFC